jgi:hypothetical protein
MALLCYVEEKAMPQVEIVSVEEAQGAGRYVPDYVALIQQVPEGKAGKLILSDKENPITARKWLVLAAKAMDLPLGIRRRGRTIYFWVESPLLQEQKTGGQQRRSQQAQPFLIDEDQEESEKPVEEAKPE